MPSVSMKPAISSTSLHTLQSRTRLQRQHSSLTPSSDGADDQKSILTSPRSTSQSTSLEQVSSSSSLVSYQTSKHSRRKTRSAPVGESTLGPQHLEHQYQMALAELREATIHALYRLGYTNPKPRSPEDIIFKPSLDMVLAARFTDVERARRRIDEADRRIQEALAMGQTWHNTPWPTDAEEEDDERINEIRQLWAKFETSELAESKAKQGSGRQKRKCREAVEDASSNSERPKRRKVATPPREESPLSALEDSPVNSTSQVRRTGLRSGAKS